MSAVPKVPSEVWEPPFPVHNRRHMFIELLKAYPDGCTMGELENISGTPKNSFQHAAKYLLGEGLVRRIRMYGGRPGYHWYPEEKLYSISSEEAAKQSNPYSSLAATRKRKPNDTLFRKATEIVRWELAEDLKEYADGLEAQTENEREGAGEVETCIAVLRHVASAIQAGVEDGE